MADELDFDGITGQLNAALTALAPVRTLGHYIAQTPKYAVAAAGVFAAATLGAAVAPEIGAAI